MALLVDLPGGQPLTLEHLVLDVNGTITRGGELIPGVAEGLRVLTGLLSVWLVSADTFGTLDTVAEQVDGARARRVRTGADKVRAVDQLGPRRCVAKRGQRRRDAHGGGAGPRGHRRGKGPAGVP